MTTANYGKYTAYYTLADGETLTLGLRAGASNQNNWMFLSDVTLTYYGERLVLDENYDRAPEGTDVDVLLQRTSSIDEHMSYDTEGRINFIHATAKGASVTIP